MTYSTIARRLRAGSALPAIALAAISITGGAIVATPAAAQDYTSGALSGTILDAQRKPISGATVTLHSQAQGQTRTFTTSGNGNFNASGLAPGTYDITVAAGGFDSYSDTINIVAAQQNNVTLPLSKAGANDIVVTGSRVRQDFTKTTTGLNIDVVGLTKDVPVARSLTGLILLAPGTIAGAPGFGTRDNAVPSIGGSSVAENAYYINGLNITNPDTYVGSTRVPFDFYKTVDVETGGYAAEFGRATGGVVNATTKSGSNTPMMAIHGNFEPVFAEATSKNTGLVASPVTIAALRHDEKESLTIEASGPIIKDHLFIYGLFQPQTNNTQLAAPTSGYLERDKSTTPFYGGKIDGYITPTQHLEFTFFDTTQNTSVARYQFTANATHDGGTIGAPTGTEQQQTGGFNWVGRYTGNITDFFQISGAYGINKDSDDLAPANTASYYVQDRRAATVNSVATVISQQSFQTASVDDTKRKFWRVDGDLRFDLVGHHHIRFGVDNEDNSETKTDLINGGLPVSYSYRNTYAILTYERLGGSISANGRAYYIQDSWEPLLGLTINAGVRDDTFKQYNLIGQKYEDFKNNFGPRIAFSYTPNGDSKFKFNGSYGRYFIPPAMNLGYRGHDDYFQEAFTYPAGYGGAGAVFPTDPNTGLPLLNFGPAYTGLAGSGFTSNCPTDMSAAPGHPVNSVGTCAVFGANIQDPAAQKVAPGTKATYEDEFILAAHYQATPLLSVGLIGTYRKLGDESEDTDFGPYLNNYYHCGTAAQTGTAAQCDFYSGGGSAYYIWNVGKKSLTILDWIDPTKTVTLTNLPFPKASRTYKAITFEWNRADDGKWMWRGNITISRSHGNYEGTVLSDVGNNVQTDAGATIAYDYVGLTDNSTGLLPNDHTFTLKTTAAYHVTKDLTLGAGLQLASPTHGSCEGIHPDTGTLRGGVDTDDIAAGYGPYSFFCGTNLVNGIYTATAAAPRGTGYKTDWFTQLDLSFRYTVPGTKLVLRADVFNVMNKKAVLTKYSQHETTGPTDGTYTPDPQYLSPTAFQQPRYARFGFDWAF